MKVAIIGTGKVGKNIGTALIGKYEVVYGSRDPAGAEVPEGADVKKQCRCSEGCRCCVYGGALLCSEASGRKHRSRESFK